MSRDRNRGDNAKLFTKGFKQLCGVVDLDGARRLRTLGWGMRGGAQGAASGICNSWQF